MTPEAKELAEIQALARQTQAAHEDYTDARKEANERKGIWEELAEQLQKRILASEEEHPLFDGPPLDIAPLNARVEQLDREADEDDRDPRITDCMDDEKPKRRKVVANG